VELRQLEHFLAVVEEGSFTRAAARLYMVQSSLSASVLALERELGTNLLIRGRGGAELTDAGRTLLEPARAALADADRARDAVAEVTGLLRGSVRVAAVAMPRSFDLAEAICDFRDRHPGVDVHVIPVGGKQMTDLVADGAVDFAITPRVPRASAALRFEPLLRTPLVAIVPTGHRLAGAQELDPTDVVEESIIDLPREWWVRALFDGWVDEAGLRRRVQLEVDDWLAVLTMVQRGTGIAYGPAALIDKDMFRGVATASLTAPPQWELGIATRDENLRGAAGRAFLAAYLQRCRGGVTDSAADRGTRARRVDDISGSEPTTNRGHSRLDRDQKRTA
jgi:DNA-binding transcriptional LysR family regulator